MAGKKGMKHYPLVTKLEAIADVTGRVRCPALPTFPIRIDLAVRLARGGTPPGKTEIRTISSKR